MLVSNQPYTSLFFDTTKQNITVIDQALLPYTFKTIALYTAKAVANAIGTMSIRGAPLIGIAGAYGFYFALRENASDEALESGYQTLLHTRPTAVNLKWALDRVKESVINGSPATRANRALEVANQLRENDIQVCNAIGEQGLLLLAALYKTKRNTIQILTHCNAGWLATVDWGTALAPVYKAHQTGIPVHVWVDETRPRLQGNLTVWELSQAGVPCTLITDNAGGHLMQQGQVDLCLVGADRVAKNGDVANKIGTYLKALAAFDNHVPFYVALPSSTMDNTQETGKTIPIEERSPLEVSHVCGISVRNTIETIQAALPGTNIYNPGFDMTPAKLITGFITEHGIRL